MTTQSNNEFLHQRLKEAREWVDTAECWMKSTRNRRPEQWEFPCENFYRCGGYLNRAGPTVEHDTVRDTRLLSVLRGGCLGDEEIRHFIDLLHGVFRIKRDVPFQFIIYGAMEWQSLVGSGRRNAERKGLPDPLLHNIQNRVVFSVTFLPPVCNVAIGHWFFWVLSSDRSLLICMDSLNTDRTNYCKENVLDKLGLSQTIIHHVPYTTSQIGGTACGLYTVMGIYWILLVITTFPNNEALLRGARTWAQVKPSGIELLRSVFALWVHDELINELHRLPQPTDKELQEDAKSKEVLQKSGGKRFSRRKAEMQPAHHDSSVNQVPHISAYDLSPDTTFFPSIRLVSPPPKKQKKDATDCTLKSSKKQSDYTFEMIPHEDLPPLLTKTKTPDGQPLPSKLQQQHSQKYMNMEISRYLKSFNIKQRFRRNGKGTELKYTLICRHSAKPHKGETTGCLFRVDVSSPGRKNVDKTSKIQRKQFSIVEGSNLTHTCMVQEQDFRLTMNDLRSDQYRHIYDITRQAKNLKGAVKTLKTGGHLTPDYLVSKVMKVIKDEHKKERQNDFRRIPHLKQHFEKNNPGSKMIIKTKEDNTFECACLTFAPLLKYTNPNAFGLKVHSLDAAHSNNIAWKGKVFVLSTKDKNLRDIPVAVGIYSSEEIVNYSHMFQTLQETEAASYMFDDTSHKTWITDWHRSLRDVIPRFQPGCLHLRCLKHFYRNLLYFVDEFYKAQTDPEAVPSTSTTKPKTWTKENKVTFQELLDLRSQLSEASFESTLNEWKERIPIAHEYIQRQKEGWEHWAYFKILEDSNHVNREDMGLCSSFVEHEMNRGLQYRHLPVCDLLQGIVMTAMNIVLERRKELMENMQSGQLIPHWENELKARNVESFKYDVHESCLSGSAQGHKWSVHKTYANVHDDDRDVMKGLRQQVFGAVHFVDWGRQTCDCGKWHGMPCCHGLAVAHKMQLTRNFQEFKAIHCTQFFISAKHKALLMDLSTKDMNLLPLQIWNANLSNDVIGPAPLAKDEIGGTTRTPSKGEVIEGTGRTKYKCSICGKSGHTKKKCPKRAL